MKTFNTIGPIRESDHYFIPRRLDWDVLDKYIGLKHYFLLHAPRQSGKTTAIKEYVTHLNSGGKYTAFYLSTEPAHIANNDITGTVYWLLKQLLREIKFQLPHEKKTYLHILNLLKADPVDKDSFAEFLEYWSENSAKPLVIFFDEFDGLVEQSLIYLLKLLRTGFPNRPEHFPQTVCLIGVRNLKDYKLQSTNEKERGVLLSPFNIIANALVLKNFTREQVNQLYSQHTQEAGQKFTSEAIDYAYYLTQGQPWLVNALAYQACFEDVLDRAKPISKEVIEHAKEQLIARRDTHFQSLIDRLREPRVRDIIDAIISGAEPTSFNPDNIEYVRDLGLLKEKSWEIANPIYQQIIPRELTYVLQDLISPPELEYVKDGKLLMDVMLNAFTQFFRENAQAFGQQLQYRESFPHLLLMAFLQRLINGGGRITREYALSRKRVDLLIEWKKQRIVIELKIKRGENTLSKGLEQTLEYADISNATEAHLIIFDLNEEPSWDQKISNEVVAYKNRNIHVWTM